MRQTSQGPIGGGIRLLCDIGHRDQRSTKPLRVMICNPCPKEHTAHPHCSPAGTKAGKQYAFLSGLATGGGRPWRRQQAGNHGRISKKMVKQAE